MVRTINHCIVNENENVISDVYADRLVNTDMDNRKEEYNIQYYIDDNDDDNDEEEDVEQNRDRIRGNSNGNIINNDIHRNRSLYNSDGNIFSYSISNANRVFSTTVSSYGSNVYTRTNIFSSYSENNNSREDDNQTVLQNENSRVNTNIYPEIDRRISILPLLTYIINFNNRNIMNEQNEGVDDEDDNEDVNDEDNDEDVNDEDHNEHRYQDINTRNSIRYLMSFLMGNGMDGMSGMNGYEELLRLTEQIGNVDRGASLEQIEKLKEEKYSDIKDGKNDTCNICLDNFCQDDNVRKLSECQHIYHKDCIDKWLQINKNCPVCRCEIKL